MILVASAVGIPGVDWVGVSTLGVGGVVVLSEAVGEVLTVMVSLDGVIVWWEGEGSVLAAEEVCP